MRRRDLFTLSNSHFRFGVGITAGLLIATAIAGFVVLPFTQPQVQFAGLWDAICSAAGVLQRAPDVIAAEPSRKLSKVVLTAQTLPRPSQEAIGRGATLAQRCAICHGPTGISRADSPNLAGQYAAVIYKQLQDFRSGARTNAVMSPFAANLTDQDITDLADYYAYLPRLPAYHPTQHLPKPSVAVFGAPMRGIAPCGACHGSLDNKTGSPWLEGQSETYMKAQLQAFASGERRNDISQQMRNIARAMTSQEIEQAARYFAAQPPETGGLME